MNNVPSPQINTLFQALFSFLPSFAKSYVLHLVLPQLAYQLGCDYLSLLLHSHFTDRDYRNLRSIASNRLVLCYPKTPPPYHAFAFSAAKPFAKSYCSLTNSQLGNSEAGATSLNANLPSLGLLAKKQCDSL